MFWLSTLLAFGALILIWLFYPSSYDYGRALGDSHYFFKTQRVGRLPANNGVSWRADALLQEEAIKISTSTSAYDLSGGYMTVRQPAAMRYFEFAFPQTQALAFRSIPCILPAFFQQSARV